MKGVQWRQLDSVKPDNEKIERWICAAPIWVLPEHFFLLKTYGVTRVVALSSTSSFTKGDSSDPSEQAVARKLSEGEERLRAWAEGRDVEWVILRPTLIYGGGRDKNIAEIARFIRRFGFFPVFGQALGKRQPVHAEDVVAACANALEGVRIANRAYNLSGGETLTYRAMVGRVFQALGRRERLLTVPLWLFRVAVGMLRLLPRYRHWTAAMAERMNRDLCFSHEEAKRDLNFSPRGFELVAADVQEG